MNKAEKFETIKSLLAQLDVDNSKQWSDALIEIINAEITRDEIYLWQQGFLNTVKEFINSNGELYAEEA